MRELRCGRWESLTSYQIESMFPKAAVPNLLWKIIFPRTGVRGVDLGMIQAHSIQAHLLLCGPVPNRPGPVLVLGPEVGDPCPNWSEEGGQQEQKIPLVNQQYYSITYIHTYIHTHVCLCGHRHTSFAHMVPDTESVLTFAPTPHFLCFYLYNH